MHEPVELPCAIWRDGPLLMASDLVRLCVYDALRGLDYPQVELNSLREGYEGWWLAYVLIRGAARVVLEPIAFPVRPTATRQDLSAQISTTLRQILPFLVAEAEGSDLR